MSSIKLTPGIVLTVNDTLNKANQTLTTVQTNLINVKVKIPSAVLCRNGISQSFQSIVNSTGSVITKLKSVNQTVSTSINRYQENENYINSLKFQYGVASKKSTNIAAFHEVWTKFIKEELVVKSAGSVWGISSKDGSDYLNVLSGEASNSLKPKYVEYEDKKAKKILEQTKKNIKQVNPDEKWYNQKGTIAEIKDDAKLEGSVIEGKIDGNSQYAEGEITAKGLTGEAHISASGGIYVYDKDENGNVKRIFSPGVQAEVGASIAAFEVDAEGRIGLGEDKNMLGAYGNVNANVLSAEGKAKVALNKDEVYAGAKAEANLAKISGTAGVSILGTDIGVNGSLKVGVGAKAEVGYTDGKLKVDIGLAVGVGFDLGFEVDVSGTVDAVCDVAEAAWEGVTDFFSGKWTIW